VNAVREAFVLPLAFLTVALLGGLELRAPGSYPAAAVGLATWSGPSLFSLVLALLLVGALVRSGVLAPDHLLHGSRPVLANANGAAVLVSLFAASAQLLHMLTPREGLPLVLVGILLFVMLVNAMAVSPDRVSLIRSLAIVTGAAFLLKFVVLAAFADQEGGLTKRALVALFDVATLGSITQAPLHPAGGYIAFFVTTMFLIAIALLPAAPPRILLSSRETTVISTRDL
jgi:hypothetical protein